jgi:hypothetical protein
MRLINKMLSRLFPLPPIKGKNRPAHLREPTCKYMANRKNPPNPYPNSELKHP